MVLSTPDREIKDAVQEALSGMSTTLPIDPRIVAANNQVDVMPDIALPDNMHGFIMRSGQRFSIGYSSAIGNSGRTNFTIAHELGHFFLPGHAEQLCPTEKAKHLCMPESSSERLEVEADRFAAELLMPTDLFCQEMGRRDKKNPGLNAIKELSTLFATSLTATANRYAEYNDAYCAVVISDNNTISYTILSETLRELLNNVSWSLKKKPLAPKCAARRVPLNTTTEEQRECYLDEWFSGAKEIPLSEESIGLGQYGKILTVLYCDHVEQDEY